MIFFGSWKLFSCLHFPLEVQLCTPPSETSSEHSLTLVSSELPAVSTFHLKTFILPSQASLPSILAADSQLCGLRIRLSKEQPWSKVYPVGTSTQEWTKPQLLAEVHMYYKSSLISGGLFKITIFMFSLILARVKWYTVGTASKQWSPQLPTHGGTRYVYLCEDNAQDHPNIYNNHPLH